MTREEASKILQGLKMLSETERCEIALDMAISALSEQKPLKERMEQLYLVESLKEDFEKLIKENERLRNALSENKGEWIPVSERLPDNNVIVLCSAISTSISGGYTRFVGCCNNGFWFVQTDAETLSYPRQYEVIAWQPLPEPYKAESEEI